jgi:hypothetical protein
MSVSQVTTGGVLWHFAPLDLPILAAWFMHFSLLAIALDVVCIIHIMRSGAERFWIYVIVFLPGVGPIAYFVAEIVPRLLDTRTSRSFARNARNTLDKGRGLRHRLAALDMADTTENRRLLAEEYVALGRYDEAIPLYESTLTGFHADDPTLLLGYARACYGHNQPQKALDALDHLKSADPDFESADGHLLYAKCLEGVGRLGEAIEEYTALATYGTGEEARCRLAMLLQQRGDIDGARTLFAEILARAKRATRHYRSTEREWIEIARRLGPAT